jgi:hypothetical protein
VWQGLLSIVAYDRKLVIVRVQIWPKHQSDVVVINTPGSPVDHHRDKKVLTRGLSGHPSSPLTPGDALAAD